MEKVRVRFAPSPTGPLHIGGVRTALFNYLFAKKNNGVFILRIEDTDQTRYVAGAENYIIESLEWCGLKFDESLKVGGNYGPYRQSERKEIYKKYAEQLVNQGNAYYAFDSSEELEEMREKLKAENNSNQQYGIFTRMQMKNSLSLTKDEVEKKLNSGENYVIRIKMPENEELEVDDLIRGKVVFNTNVLDDKVLYKSDGMPTYHLANIVDDHLMEISHVIRGEEWLPSLPLHKLLYRYFAWENTMPLFAHLPLLLKPTGKGKLSKRDGDQGGFPVFPLEWKDPETGDISSGYRESGYFADSFINMMALLGWNPGTEQEIFTMQELIEQFSIEKVGKSGSKFDPEKAKWFNHQYLQTKTDDELTGLYQIILKEKGFVFENSFVKNIVSIIKERANFVSDFWEHSDFFFKSPGEYDIKMIKKWWKEETPNQMKELIKVLNEIENFKSENIETIVKQWLEEKNYKMGQIMTAFRLAVVGEGKGPHMFDIVDIIGKKETIERIEKAIKNISLS
ncbi:MAG: glutamate--tRNA ligase [Bacteroidales bacterium]|nr:glutamate--tRNA ligase [Bacteroidales bacterium]MBN2757777.1 glutamate--tRNA ligase [Bacteroidales bacterium]